MLLLCSLLLAALVTGQDAPSKAPSLKATIRMTVAKIDTPAVRDDEKPSPYGNFGPLLSQLLTPEGPVDIDYLIAGGQTRADVRGRLATLPKGSVVLQKMGDETIRVLNPGNRTWYEIPANRNLGILLGTPDVSIEPTGEKDTIAGQPAERFRFSQTLQVPVPEGTSLPPEFPKEVQLSGDLWSTNAYAGGDYAQGVDVEP